MRNLRTIIRGLHVHRSRLPLTLVRTVKLTADERVRKIGYDGAILAHSACLRHATNYVCLDNAFVLIEGHPGISRLLENECTLLEDRLRAYVPLMR
jgi:hypothetical protein